MVLTQEQSNYVEKLYKEMYTELVIYSSGALTDKQLKEDVVQETFVIACTKINNFFKIEAPEFWLKKVLRHVIHNTRRWHASERKRIDFIISIDDINVTYTDNLDELINLCNILNEDEFSLIRKCVIKGYTETELAAISGISVTACRKRIQRQKTKLKMRLDII